MKRIIKFLEDKIAEKHVKLLNGKDAKVADYIEKVNGKNVDEEALALIPKGEVYMARIWDGIGCPDFGLTKLCRNNNTSTRWFFVVTKSAVKMYVYERGNYGMNGSVKLVATF